MFECHAISDSRGVPDNKNPADRGDFNLIALASRIGHLLDAWVPTATAPEFWRFFESYDDQDERRILEAFREGDDSELGMWVRRLVTRNAADFIGRQIAEGKHDDEVWE